MTPRTLLAYAPWQARDGVVKALVSVVIFALIAGIPLATVPRSIEGGWSAFSTDPQMMEFARTLYFNIGGLAMLLGAIMQHSQVIALDRERQYFRFLFAHQVAPWAFYLQRYVVGLLMFSLFFMVIPLVFSKFVTPIPILGTLKATLFFGSFVGALAVLAGAITKKDGLLLIGVYLVSSALQQPSAYDALPTWAQWISKLLPSTYAAGAVRDAWLKGAPIVSADFWLVAGWTVGMLVAALVIIRRFPLAR